MFVENIIKMFKRLVKLLANGGFMEGEFLVQDEATTQAEVGNPF